MPPTLKRALHDTLDHTMPDDLGKAVNGVLKDLHEATDKVQSATDDTLSKIALGLTVAALTLAAELRSHTASLARHAKRDIRSHPVTTFAALATAVLTLTGVVMAVRHQREA